MSFQWGAFSKKALESIAYSNKRINIWDGAVRSGKTVNSIVAWAYFVAGAPGGALLMAGKTLDTLRRNILDPMREMFDSDFSFSLSKGEGKLFGRTVYLMGAADTRAEEKIRGLTLAGAYGDEITVWPKNFFAMLLSRLSVRGARFYGSTNPDSRFHWLLIDYLQKPGLDLTRWHFQLKDNPNLPQEYIDAIQSEYSGMFRRRFVDGEWCAPGGLVYDMFDPQIHIADFSVIDGSLRCFAACDYGIRNPCVFGLIRTDTEHYHLAREYYHTGRDGRPKTDEEYADDLEAFVQGETRTVIVDPSALSFITLLGKRGWKVIPARNGVLEGIWEISAFLSNGKLTIAPDCKRTRMEFENYVWDETSQKDKPVKDHDHCMDMLRYGVCTDKSMHITQRRSFSGKSKRI